MNCPRCNRATYYPVKSTVKGQRRRTKPAGAPAHAIAAGRKDGTCCTCIHVEMGKVHRTGVGANLHPGFSEADVQRSTRSLLNYWQRRQRCGVPSEGHDVATLVKPGLFLSEVP